MTKKIDLDDQRPAYRISLRMLRINEVRVVPEACLEDYVAGKAMAWTDEERDSLLREIVRQWMFDRGAVMTVCEWCADAAPRSLMWKFEEPPGSPMWVCNVCATEEERKLE